MLLLEGTLRTYSRQFYMDVLDIVEIIRPADQGRTMPFLCRAEDEELYYVKGRSAGTRGQFCEWVVAHLAVAFGIPIPPFRLVTVPAELLEESPSEHRVLGAGVAFASLARTQAQWFEGSFIRAVSQDLRCAVLAFDWWIQNSDRIFDNPNLLFSPVANELVVIDHAFAFDSDFWPTIFLQYHIFRDDWAMIVADPGLREQYRDKMINAIKGWQDACDSAPRAWLIKGAGDEEEAFDCAAALQVLTRCETEDLWNEN